MSIFYLTPAALLWLAYAASWWFGAPLWIDYLLFGGACAATAIGSIIAAIVESGGPRW